MITELETTAGQLVASIDERVLMLYRMRVELLRRARPNGWTITAKSVGGVGRYVLTGDVQGERVVIELGRSIPGLVRELVDGPYPNDGEPF